MGNKFSNIKERVLKLAEKQEGNKQVFFNKIGMTYGNFTGKAKETPLNSNAIENILLNYPDTNPTWLLTGKGTMLLNTYPSLEDNNTMNVVSEPVSVYGKNNVQPNTQNIPLYDIEAAAGIVSLFNDTHNNPIDHIRIPGIPKCDGAIPISGDSMYPLLKSGDIVLYKQVTDPLDAIYFFGEMYIIGIDQDGDNYVVVKYIHKSDKGDTHIKLVSQNQHHDPFDIPKSSIRALAIVRASIRINSMK